jgi:hypothetical protein
MDTEWFAVDADGCVARFDSGEAGAVPNNAAVGLSPGDSSFDTFAFDAARLARVLARSGLTDQDRKKPTIPPAGAPAAENLRAVFMVRASSEPYRDGGPPRSPCETSLPEEKLLVIRARAPRIVATRSGIENAAFWALVKHDDVEAIWTEHDLYDRLRDGEVDDGLFTYDNVDYEDPGAYERGFEPSEPMRLDDVPGPAREAIAKVRLPVRFPEARAIQLLSHVKREELAAWGWPDDPEPAPPPTPAPVRSLAILGWLVAGVIVLGGILVLVRSCH